MGDDKGSFTGFVLAGGKADAVVGVVVATCADAVLPPPAAVPPTGVTGLLIAGSTCLSSYSFLGPSTGLKSSLVFLVRLFSTFVEFQASPNCGLSSLFVFLTVLTLLLSTILT